MRSMGIAVCALFVVSMAAFGQNAGTTPATATFYRDVLPILQAKCQELPSSGRSGTDVVPHIREHASMG